MNLYRTYILLAWVFIFVLTAGSVYAVPVVKKWDVFEVRLEAEEEYDNPYEAGFPEEGKSLATMTFSGMNREAAGMEMKVHAFWDGKNYWRARFAPPAEGDWAYMSESADPGMDGIGGTIRCEDWSDAEKKVNATRRGYVRVCKEGPRAGRFF